jgi:hypothetical protein
VAHPPSYSKGTGDPFPGCKARPGRDADHSPPSSTEVKNDLALYRLSPQAPSWSVVGLIVLGLKQFIRIINMGDEVSVTFIRRERWYMPRHCRTSVKKLERMRLLERSRESECENVYRVCVVKNRSQ